jgi:hypothetical protein
LALCAEYTHRYGKVHAVQAKLEWLKEHEPNGIPDVPMTVLTPNVPVECFRLNLNPLSSLLLSPSSLIPLLSSSHHSLLSHHSPSLITLPLSSLSLLSHHSTLSLRLSHHSHLLFHSLSPTHTQVQARWSEGPSGELQGVLRFRKALFR